MMLVLTTGLVRFLIKNGYQYCLSDTIAVGQDEDAFTSIILKPVKNNLMPKKLPKSFDKYYNLIKEPLEMASGSFGFLIQVNLSKKDFQAYNSTQ